jgi:hypothetical protein
MRECWRLGRCCRGIVQSRGSWIDRQNPKGFWAREDRRARTEDSQREKVQNRACRATQFGPAFWGTLPNWSLRI